MQYNIEPTPEATAALTEARRKNWTEEEWSELMDAFEEMDSKGFDSPILGDIPVTIIPSDKPFTRTPY